MDYNDYFDITMGTTNSAQVTDLVGLYLLAQIKDSCHLMQSDIYRDDVLFAMRGLSRARLNRLRKDLGSFIKLFFCFIIVLDMNTKW